ncbi:MAG: DUF4375 domain-containing protein [Phycisphaerae bacterium]|nr:DUF4375 domain-containing protein [Gemmatimonadaceae bacterium]
MNKLDAQSVIEELEAEINNGGLDQYFTNSAGDRAHQAVRALRAVRAEHTATIIERAIAKFPNALVPGERDLRLDILEDLSPHGDLFAAEDAAFLEYRDDLAGLVAAYLERT